MIKSFCPGLCIFPPTHSEYTLEGIYGFTSIYLLGFEKRLITKQEATFPPSLILTENTAINKH